MSNLFIEKRNPNELLALTGIRGIAALLVVLSHINLFFISTFHVSKIVYVQPFVDLFFVLSGFVISLVYIKKAEWTKDFFYKFYSARFARIYPLYIITLIILAVLTVLAIRSSPHTYHNNEAISSVAIIKQLLLVNAMPFAYCKMLILTSWSVSIEWWLYILLFPLLMLLKGVRSFLAKPVCMIILSCLLILYLYQPHMTEAATVSWPAFARGVVGFTLGWLTHWHFSNNTKLSEFCKRYCDIMMVVAAIILLISPLFIPTQPWTALIIFPFLILGLCYKGPTSTKVFSSKFFVILGDISYSVYLLHPIVLQICSTMIRKFLHVNEDILMVGYTLVVVGGTLVISYFSYVYIEAPVRAAIYKYLIKKKPYKYSSLV
jgi:peptidoglycan/LPS O-acetylase OafA/YrhL